MAVIALCMSGDGGSGGKGIIASGDGGEGGTGGKSDPVKEILSGLAFQEKEVTELREVTEEPEVPEDTERRGLYCRKRVKRTTLLKIIYRQMKKTF